MLKKSFSSLHGDRTNRSIVLICLLAFVLALPGNVTGEEADSPDNSTQDSLADKKPDSKNKGNSLSSYGNKKANKEGTKQQNDKEANKQQKDKEANK